MLRRPLLPLVVAALTFLPATAASAPTAQAPPLRVLFIGNSLTSWHNLPGYVASLAKRSGDSTFRYRMIAPPAVGLEDHWRIPRTRRALAEERWDVVVMQQGRPPNLRVGCTSARGRSASPISLGLEARGRAC